MNKITADHLARRACVYIRQSTPGQVQHNLESQRRQYALVDRARALGWQDVDVIDDDLGISGCGTRRPGFERLLRARCAMGRSAPFSALRRRGWRAMAGTGIPCWNFVASSARLLIDAEAVYDPRLTNDRLLLGMKGTISEMEVASFRERAQAAMLQKAQRGALIRRAAIGYVKGPDDRIEKDPDARVRSGAWVVLPVSAVEGAEITTVEGLSPDGTHPLQRAWEELDVPQCGYCQAGQLMSAAALLAKTPKPTDAQIDAAMNGNLCRCATYLRIRQAIHRAAAMPATPAAQAGKTRAGANKR